MASRNQIQDKMFAAFNAAPWPLLREDTPEDLPAVVEFFGQELIQAGLDEISRIEKLSCPSPDEWNHRNLIARVIQNLGISLLAPKCPVF